MTRFCRCAFDQSAGPSPELLFRVFGASFRDTPIGYFWKKDEVLVFCDMKHLYLQVCNETPEAACERIQAALAVAG